jgi:hypothetical protein
MPFRPQPRDSARAWFQFLAVPGATRRTEDDLIDQGIRLHGLSAWRTDRQDFESRIKQIKALTFKRCPVPFFPVPFFPLRHATTVEPEAVPRETLSRTRAMHHHRTRRRHSQEGLAWTTKKRPGPPFRTAPGVRAPHPRSCPAPEGTSPCVPHFGTCVAPRRPVSPQYPETVIGRNAAHITRARQGGPAGAHKGRPRSSPGPIPSVDYAPPPAGQKFP